MLIFFMKNLIKKILVLLLTILMISSMIFILSSCSKSVEPDEETLSFSFPLLSKKHDLYFHLDHEARSIELLFNENIDQQTVAGNIILSDQTGFLNAEYNIEVIGKIVTLQFNDDYSLHDGWKYLLNITKGLKSINGISLKEDETIELRTTGKPIDFTGYSSTIRDTIQRNAIVCISDLHMGDNRATTNNYCEFNSNAQALEDFLDFILINPKVKQLVICGDLLDEWMVPYDIAPFDSLVGIHNSEDYFQAIANNPVNLPIFDKFRDIANHNDIDLVYIPGNHDMLVTQDIIEGIIPGIIWEGNVAGLGIYSPLDDIIMEHGHRYDLFNCPQPLVNNGHMIPPGYFITRLYAKGMASQNSYKPSEFIPAKGSFEFFAAWNIAFLKVLSDFNMECPEMNSPNVKMTGLDDYYDNFSFNEAYDMYAANIEDLWQQTQSVNQVPVPIDVLTGIWNGLDLSGTPIIEYMINPSTSQYKIIIFGHSHYPHLMVYPSGQNYTSVYANSGSWVDPEYSEYDVRTFVVLCPGEWTGSEIDVLMLYKYDPDGLGYAPVLISEESINID